MLNDANVSNLMKNTMENLKDMIDVNTVIGDPIETKDGTFIIPVSRLCFGFVSGGSEYPTSNKSFERDNFPFGGGSSAGVSVKPVAFLIIRNGNVRMITIDHDTTYDKIVDTVPQVLDIINGLVKDSNKKTPDDINININENQNADSDI